MTRLRLNIKDKTSVDTEALKKIEGVLGVVYSGNQLQVILGKNLIPIFHEVSKMGTLSAKESVSENLDEKIEVKKNDSHSNNEVAQKHPVIKILTNVVNFISDSVVPMVAGLVAGGMLKVILLLISLAVPAFVESQNYMLLSQLSNAPFYFMPIFVAYGVATKLGATPIYSMVVSAALLYPDFVELIKGGAPVGIMGIPVGIVSYSNSLLPALLIGICAHYVEGFLNKVIPGIFKSIFVGLSTICITFILGITILGPLGDYMGSYFVIALIWLQNTIGPIATALLAGLLPLVIMTGMHHVFSPFMVQAIANPGYDGLFRPALILHNMAEGGACLGVALRAKNKEFRTEALSIAMGCVLAGVTEPAIYGITLRLKKPLYGVMAGGAAGGLVAGIMGAKAFIMGYSTILAIPIFKDTIMAIVLGIIVSFVVSCLVTVMLGYDEDLVVNI